MVGTLKINSDFNDFYDYLSTDDSVYVYDRYLKNRMTVAEGLSRLRAIGIKTVETKAAREIQSEYIILHNGHNSSILRSQEALLLYPNSLATEYNIENNTIYKLIQVGARRFRVILKIKDYSLDKYDILSIDEVNPSYNMGLQIPIYSIDYVNTDKGMLALKMNSVESLSKYKIDTVIKPDEVVESVRSSLLKYNKL